MSEDEKSARTIQTGSGDVEIMDGSGGGSFAQFLSDDVELGMILKEEENDTSEKTKDSKKENVQDKVDDTDDEDSDDGEFEIEDVKVEDVDTDEDDNDEEEQTDENTDTDEEADETRKKEQEDSEAKNTDTGYEWGKEPNAEQLKTQTELLGLVRQAERLAKIIDRKPVQPKDLEDDEAYDAYKRKLERWQDKAEEAQDDVSDIRDEIRAVAERSQAAFIANHPELSKTDLQELHTFVKTHKILYSEWVQGKDTLETALGLFLLKTGRLKKAEKQHKENDQKKVKTIKPVSTSPSGKGTKQVTKSNAGLPSKYKYANKPELATYVTALRKGRNPMTGAPHSFKDIEDMARQEYLEGSGKSIF